MQSHLIRTSDKYHIKLSFLLHKWKMLLQKIPIKTFFPFSEISKLQNKTIKLFRITSMDNKKD